MIKPLTGQILVEILPEPKQTNGGIVVPDHTLSPEEKTERNRDPGNSKPAAQCAVVWALGPWPKLKCGLTLMPEFGVGAKVFVHPNRGQPLQSEPRRFKLMRTEDVLAVMQNSC